MHLDTIHKDERGDIHLLLGDLDTLEEVTIFKTKKGFARGGCIHHKSDEYCVLFEGEVIYIIGDKRSVCKPGDRIYIPVNTPHYFIALSDCVMAEWGAPPE